MRIQNRRAIRAAVCAALMGMTLGAFAAQTFVAEDTYVYKKKKKNNFDGATKIELANAGKQTRQGFLKFDLSSVSESVVSAELKLYSQTQDGLVEVYKIEDNSWKPSVISWKKKPAMSGKIGSADASPNSWFVVDVSSFVKAGGVYSFGLKTPNKAVGTLASSESNKDPVLLIDTEVQELVPPHFLSDPILKPAASVGVDYKASIANDAEDPDSAVLTFAKVSGSAWLDVRANGALRGSPSSADLGLNVFEVQVTDETGASATAMLEIDVVDIPPPPPPPDHWNIVLIYIDDLGWMDLACQGSTFYETPHIDQLASEGMRFTQAYTAYPRCLPARYGLLTGRNPGRDGVPGGNPGQLTPGGNGSYTIAEALKDAGYATFFAGKWHLTSGETGNQPHNQGFDVNIGGGSAGEPPTYFYPYRADKKLNANPHDGMEKDGLYHLGDKNDYDNGARMGEYITDRLTDETIDWMRSNADKPMFVMLSHYAVHEPFERKPPAGMGSNPEFEALVQKYEAKRANMNYGNLPEFIASGIGEEKIRQDFPVYAAMVEKVDQSVGRVMAEIEALGIADNTVVIFSSDNGGLSNRGTDDEVVPSTSNYPLRTGKGWLYEGGIREAFMVKWPGVVQPGVVNTDDVVIQTDLYPTMLKIADLPLSPADHKDGISILPALKDEEFVRTDPLIWHSPKGRPYRTGDFNGSAIRVGDYKLIDWYDSPNGTELFNIVEDKEENHNLVDQLPLVAEDLLAVLTAWRDNTPGVVIKSAQVSKPPQAYLDDPSIPFTSKIRRGKETLTWDKYAGFDYKLYYNRGNGWELHTSGISGTSITVPEKPWTYRVELKLLPE